MIVGKIVVHDGWLDICYPVRLLDEFGFPGAKRTLMSLALRSRQEKGVFSEWKCYPISETS